MSKKEEVLRLVNLARMVLGLPALTRLPLGFRARPNSCVIANSIGTPCGLLGTRFGAHEISEAVAEVWGTTTDSDDRAVHPEALREFIAAFDAGEYPELVQA